MIIRPGDDLQIPRSSISHSAAAVNPEQIHALLQRHVKISVKRLCCKLLIRAVHYPKHNAAMGRNHSILVIHPIIFIIIEEIIIFEIHCTVGIVIHLDKFIGIRLVEVSCIRHQLGNQQAARLHGICIHGSSNGCCFCGVLRKELLINCVQNTCRQRLILYCFQFRCVTAWSYGPHHQGTGNYA
ncbi:hypothetical protein D3C76_1260120 [compost metagenome]